MHSHLLVGPFQQGISELLVASLTSPVVRWSLPPSIRHWILADSSPVGPHCISVVSLCAASLRGLTSSSNCILSKITEVPPLVA